MESIYEDIARCTGGCIYIGVVGPVRTGKSTFIKRFMETLVIPRIDDEYARARARDELPQSGSGRTVMTSEPKFVPEDGVEVTLEGGVRLSVRLVDCVGFMVDGATGSDEDGSERMVATPWFDHEVTMSEAAETGTRRVISEHSTIGVVMTTDGSITDIPREAYVEAEERCVRELRAQGKPFVILLNCREPGSDEAQTLRAELAAKYDVTCVALNCLALDAPDVEEILRGVLCEFPLTELALYLPSWFDALPDEHAFRSGILASVRDKCGRMSRIRDAEPAVRAICAGIDSSEMRIKEIDPAVGRVSASLTLPGELFYSTLSDISGFDVTGDGALLGLLTELRDVKREYDRLSEALAEVRETGYGVVMPSPEEMTLAEPEIVRHGGRYGVKMKATAPSIHMVLANIETEVSPVIGGGQRSEGMIDFLLSEFEGDTGRIWDSNIFGKPLSDIAAEGVQAKLKKLSPEVRSKLQETIQRIANEGGNGLICIIV
ncbi:MAG: stage IV sporulation protein A [Oscillospiraceae bacterium]|nr:stage IV sporulation protein A [Oscillospiraceae bacterium]